MSSLSRSYTSARIIETLDNYVRADDPLTTHPEPHATPSRNGNYIYDDERFWMDLFQEPERYNGRAFPVSSGVPNPGRCVA